MNTLCLISNLYNMKKKITFTFAFIFMVIAGTSAQSIFGQALAKRNSDVPKELKEYRFTKTDGTLHLQLGYVVIEGYKGDEVIISTLVEVPAETNDPRAAGLTRINRTGLPDNTGLGISIKEDGTITEISGTGATSRDTVFIKIPSQLSISVKGVAVWSGGDLTVKNVQGEIEMFNTRGDVSLIDVTGPVSVSTLGNIEARFSAPVTGPVSLISNTGFVDVALPATTKANIEMNAFFGELLAAEDLMLTIKSPSKPTAEQVPVSTTMDSTQRRSAAWGLSMEQFGRSVQNSLFTGNNHVKGTMNGGGEHIILKTNYGKIYLRKAN